MQIRIEETKIEISKTETDKTETSNYTPAYQEFKRQLAELVKYKTPKEMTLEEYRQYIKEKIRKIAAPISGVSNLDIKFTDMALVEMKYNPKLEKAVLEGIRYICLRNRRRNKTQVSIQIRHTREEKLLEKKQLQGEILLRKTIRKKRLEICYEEWEWRQEAYTEFLETGERYVLPSSAIRFFAPSENILDFLGMPI